MTVTEKLLDSCEICLANKMKILGIIKERRQSDKF